MSDISRYFLAYINKVKHKTMKRICDGTQVLSSADFPELYSVLGKLKERNPNRFEALEENFEQHLQENGVNYKYFIDDEKIILPKYSDNNVSISVLEKEPPAPFSISTDSITIRQGDTVEIPFENDSCTVNVESEFNLVTSEVQDGKLALKAVTNDSGSDHLTITCSKEYYTDRVFNITVIVPDVTISSSVSSVAVDENSTKDITITTNGDDINYTTSNDNVRIEEISTSRDAESNLVKTYRILAQYTGDSEITFNSLVDSEIIESIKIDSNSLVNAPFSIDTGSVSIKQGQIISRSFTNNGCTVTAESTLGTCTVNSNNVSITSTSSGTGTITITASKNRYTSVTKTISLTVKEVTISSNLMAVTINGSSDYKDVIVTTNGDSIAYSINNSNCAVSEISSSRSSNNDLVKVFRIQGLCDGGSIVTFNSLVSDAKVKSCTCGVTITDHPFIDFTASANTSYSINLFFASSNFNTADFDVYINDVKTSQTFNSLTFSANDRVWIKANKKVTYYPLLYVNNNGGMKNYIKSINSAFPLMSTNNSSAVTNFKDCFNSCVSLTSIPADLFKYNTQVTNFQQCFYGCASLTSIPADLFKYNTQVTNFFYCFKSCTGLTSIPANLFKYNTKVTNFAFCFQLCSNVTGALPTLWISHPKASHAQCFLNCTKASNYQAAKNAGWAG